MSEPVHKPATEAELAAWAKAAAKSAAAAPFPKAGVGPTRLPAAAAIRYYP